MKQRTNKLIQPDFQLRTIFTVIGISTIAFLLITAVVGINAYQNNRKISATVKDLNEAIALQDSIVNTFIDNTTGLAGLERLQAQEKINADYNKSIGVLRRYVQLLYSFAKQNFHLITLILSVVFAQGFLLYFYLLKLTHRISGPIYVMTRHIEDIMEGREPHFRELRDKDEFKEFYQKFVRLAEKTVKGEVKKEV